MQPANAQAMHHCPRELASEPSQPWLFACINMAAIEESAHNHISPPIDWKAVFANLKNEVIEGPYGS